MIKTAIILAGGFGTRLQSVVKDLPKPMADISDAPFLSYLLDYLCSQGIRKVVLSVGYKWETIKNYFGDTYKQIELIYSIEDTPLGTGGAILKATLESNDAEYFIINGDTFFDIDLELFEQKHRSKSVDLSIALKRMKEFDRYGVVKTNADDYITSFEEKRFYSAGNINGGVYILNKRLFADIKLIEKFSFEKDIMEKFFDEKKFAAFSFSNYFIDIGIPEDYLRAQSELPALIEAEKDLRLLMNAFHIDSSWSLFLDRDGVINRKVDGDYIRSLQEFDWLDGAKESIIQLSKFFRHTFIVSNQQGVGKGLMKSADVENIHDHIMKAINKGGGLINHVYYAPQLHSENSPMRKPNIGMALKAKEDFPDIDLRKSIMVGDSISDMEFGKNAGMKTIFISKEKLVSKGKLIDAVAADLSKLASLLRK